MTGIQIRQQREKLGLSREELAVKIGVSLQTIYRWEKELASPHKTFVIKLEEILNKEEV